MLVINTVIMIFLILHFCKELLHYGITKSNMTGNIMHFEICVFVILICIVFLGIFIYHILRIGGLLT